MSTDPTTPEPDAAVTADARAGDASGAPAAPSEASGATSAAVRAPHAMTPERERLMRRLTPALLVVGAFLLVVFESTITLLLGVTLLLAAVVCGVITIAEPGFLAGDDDPR